MGPRAARRFSRLLLLAVALATAAGVGARAWLPVRNGAHRLANQHLQYRKAHPGWSFPAHVWSDSAPLDLPKARLAEQARAREYEEACPATEPGQFCPKTGELIPRGGLFPEGPQPAGLTGWTRPIALEPVLVGTLIGPDAEIREHLPLSLAPRHLVDAIVQAEDAAYYNHHGVNVASGLRAAWVNARSGQYRQGSSTLTMQVVRNLSGRKEKRISRKIWEMFTAFEIDRYLGKEWILQIYLDAPYLGQMGNFSICGFQAAARYYWGTDAKDLTLSQAATLAAILPAPGKYAPDRFPEAARERRNVVLQRMTRVGYDVTDAMNDPIDASPHPFPTDRYPSYLQSVRVWLESNLPQETIYGAGLDVFTALDLYLQETGDRVLPERIAFLNGMLGLGMKDKLEGAGTLIDQRTGMLVAVNDARQVLATDFNRATQARRQPGSAFKPMVYALAFTQRTPEGKPRFTSAYALPNAPRVFPNTNGWSPRNISGEYSETSSLANALAWSQNIATASLLEELGGPEPIIAFAQALGFDTSRWPHEMGLALGQAEVTVLEMSRFVSTVANGGYYPSGSPVYTVIDPAGHQRIPATELGERVIDEEAAALTRDLMRLVVEFGTGGRVRGTGGYPGYQGPIIGKTGTTDGEKDVWFVGATPYYAGAIWLGFEVPDRLGASASDLAAPCFGWWFREVHKGLPTDDFGGKQLQHRGICTVSGKLPNGTCRVIPAPFVPGTSPFGGCPFEHLWPPEEAEGEMIVGGEAAPEDQKRWRSIWDRMAAERAAQDGATAQPGATPEAAPVQRPPASLGNVPPSF